MCCRNVGFYCGVLGGGRLGCGFGRPALVLIAVNDCPARSDTFYVGGLRLRAVLNGSARNYRVKPIGGGAVGRKRRMYLTFEKGPG